MHQTYDSGSARMSGQTSYFQVTEVTKQVISKGLKPKTQK